ncbi:uncharacterized protein LOC123865107 [Maniola jurtina]|uniref:uncharacterized protein LOC123865107 n=1 Tax=Maniola jurtina TaxID=191418 RepID=UPI001E68BBA5|nr:uncharacterized protein LOC123865107 [Maniola jurtina]XP_045761908.1 uncharacterized protein LOC123865107 [Maniola jurtina]XP_045761909.1 uncharacterized protein LOC123865107 [Maniola jurtina]
MLKLKGNNLGKRHQELNKEVIKTTSENVDFDLVKGLKEDSDADRLYKIDVASVYKNMDYIIETLKCGDSLYISRALKKCTWLYENENSYIINPDYLHHEVFPFMSSKMTKKLLTTISIHVRDEKRAEDFYNYCIRDKKLNNIATKFLVWTSEQHKLEYINKNNHIDKIKLKYIIGNSFDLAEVYLTKEKWQMNEKVHALCYLINISSEKYLNLMEKYIDISTNAPKLGHRYSKVIITKHKERVSNNVQLYLNKLNLDVVAKHSSVEDVKKYAIALLPPTAEEFWSMDFYDTYKKIFKILPQNEVYRFLREIFLSKYLNEPFEMSKNFYNLNYYKLLTSKEREMWALENLKQNNVFPGKDDGDIWFWYQFVNFELAFKEIKTCIAVCNSNYKREAMVDVLIDSVKNEEELEKLLKYYYERHINESEGSKMEFIENIIDKHNAYKFDENSWDVFNKILHSTSFFSKGYSAYGSNSYKTFIIIYCFIHNKPIPKILEDYVITRSNAQCIKYDMKNLHEKLTNEQMKAVYQKCIDLCTNKLKLFDTQTYDAVKNEAREIFDFALVIMEAFEKTKDDCPDIILKYMKLDDYYKGYKFVNNNEEITEGTLLRLLKVDSQALLQKFADISGCFPRIRINNLLKKIKVYFSNDVAKDWLSRCESLLLDEYEYDLFTALIVSVFLIGSDDYKIMFVSKYVPEEVKISHDSIDRKLLAIQERICRLALHSRPPIPLECILPYIKGDYVHYCLPMFGSYLSNLPRPLCIKFVSAILNTPVSVQKHGLRLAFHCFSIEDLINLIDNVWKSTKNVSLRMTIFKALCEKIENVDENSQQKLYEVLKMLTSDLHENDTDDVFNLLTHFKLSQFKADFLKTAWYTVSNLPEQRSKNIQRKLAIINKMESEIAIIDKEFCRSQILDKFVRSILTDQNIGQFSQNKDMKSLIEAKWKLAAKYIIYIDNDQSLELLHFILQRCTEMWNVTDNGYYTSRKLLFEFIDTILLYSYCKDNKAESIPVLEYIVMILSEFLPMTQFYKLYVKLNLIIISKKIIGLNQGNYSHLIPENVASGLAAEVLVFLNDLKVKKLWYPSFSNKIGSLLCKAIETMSYGTNLQKVEILKTLVSSHLIEAQLPEAHLLALCILPPQRPEECRDIWSGVIDKIQSGDNVELQAYLQEYLVHNNNFKEI